MEPLRRRNQEADALADLSHRNKNAGVGIGYPGRRALAGEDEIIFSVPAAKVEGLVTQLKMFDERKFGYRHHAFLEMRPDFPRPDFYKNFFRQCGLDADDVPTWPVR